MNGFHPIPEWHPQDAVILVWPHPHSDWAATLDKIYSTYVEITRIISQIQAVIIIYYDLEHKIMIQEQCAKSGCNLKTIAFVQIETNDTWVRDYGPQILSGHDQHLYLDPGFNAWGNQYPHHLDRHFAKKFYPFIDQICSKFRRTEISLEGGNLEFNDDTTLMTNFSCIKKNNPDLEISRQELEKYLQTLFSLSHVISLDIAALQGDDTDGHIDTLARFIDNNTIVYAQTKDLTDPNYQTLAKLEKQLHELNEQQGTNYTLIPVLMPKNIFYSEAGNILPASYINFVFINGYLLVPLYNDVHDALALKIFTQLCPGRTILGINATELIQQFGSLHCATLHLPKNTLDEDRISTAK